MPIAVDAVFDSVSVATTFKERLAKDGIIFCAISEAVQEHPELVRSTSARWCRRATTSTRAQQRGLHRRQLRLHPQGRALPDGAEHLLPHQREEHRPVRAHAHHRRRGQPRLLPEGCTAPMRDENQLHAAVVELVAMDDATIKYSTVQNWYPGDAEGRGGIYNFVTKRATAGAPAPR
jgi:Fe-S cluster assembly protein SufB